MKRIIKNSNENLSFTKILSFIQNIKSILKVNSTMTLNSTLNLNPTASFKRMTPLKLSTTLPLNSILKLFFTIFIFNATINLATAANNPKATGFVVELSNGTEVSTYKFTKGEPAYVCLMVDNSKKNKNGEYYAKKQINTSGFGNNLSSNITLTYEDQTLNLNQVGFRYSVSKVNVRIEVDPSSKNTEFMESKIILTDLGFWNDSFESNCTGFLFIGNGVWSQSGSNTKTLDGLKNIFYGFNPTTAKNGDNTLSLNYQGCSWFNILGYTDGDSCSDQIEFKTSPTLISRSSKKSLIKKIKLCEMVTKSWVIHENNTIIKGEIKSNVQLMEGTNIRLQVLDDNGNNVTNDPEAFLTVVGVIPKFSVPVFALSAIVNLFKHEDVCSQQFIMNKTISRKFNKGDIVTLRGAFYADLNGFDYVDYADLNLNGIADNSKTRSYTMSIYENYSDEIYLDLYNRVKEHTEEIY